MTDKVLIACVYYDNGESYEDHYYYNSILGVFRTLQGVEDAFERHIEARRNDYRRVRPGKDMPFGQYLGDPKNSAEFYFYAKYNAIDDYDDGSFVYYYLVKEVEK